MDATPPVVASSSGIFGPVGSGGFGSPRSERYHSDMVFDPFRRNSPALGSPGAAANNGAGGGHARKQQLVRAGHSAGAIARGHVQVAAAAHGGRQVLGRRQARPRGGGEHCGGPSWDRGKSLVEIQRFSGAAIQISKKGTFAPGTRNRIVSITGTPNAVSTAQYLIEQQIAEEEAKRSQQNALGVLR
ncbi:hypothetical protein MRX96_007332 [Rhipicephalus microplus]